MMDVGALDYTKGGGLVTVVAQDAGSGRVLMVAHADREAMARSVATGELHLHSRTRGAWHKGATSGNTMRVVSLAADCDHDAVLAVVEPKGPACHTGSESCFTEGAATGGVLAQLDAVIASRVTDPESAGYTRRLLDLENLRLKKLGEEAVELALACASKDATRAVSEAADLVYHALVALRAVGASWADVERELATRRAQDARS